LNNPQDLTESVSWVKRENWHITVKFLGEVPDAQVPNVKDVLAHVKVEPMELFADRMLYFPKRGPVRVIAIGIGGDAGRLNQLYDRIEEACQQLGFPKENRPYRAHITLARSRQGQGGNGHTNVRSATLATQFPGPSFHSNQFVLMQSELHPQGSRYTAVAKFAVK
jgi:2'-5' RNA ligase